MDVTALKAEGFVSVTYPPPLQKCVKEAMRSWQDFCQLPSEQKRIFSNDNRLNDFGYMLRADTGTRADKKELFHVVRHQIPELRKHASKIADSRALAFIDAIDALLVESTKLIIPFARAVEEQYGLDSFEEEVSCARDNWTFRYLHYFGGKVLAHPHADRGGFTLHLHESKAGGEYYTFNKKWEPWPVSEKQTIIFPSMGLQYRSKNTLKALWHRVTATEAESERYAMVCFIDFKQDYRYNGARRLQNFPPGFNYDISFAELKKLFVPR